MITLTIKVVDNFTKSSTEVVKVFESGGDFGDIFYAVKEALLGLGFHPDTVREYFDIDNTEKGEAKK